MKTKWKFLATIATTFLSFMYISNFQVKTVDALTSEDNEALANHPGGLNIKEYFTIDDFSYVNEFPFKTNSAKIKGTNSDVLVLTDGEGTDVTGTVGAIWGNASQQNYLNINEEQTISAWLYFGPGKTDELYNGHGMTLTLQNDSRKTKAIGMGLQGLGAYAYDKNYNIFSLSAIINTPASEEYLMNTAIKNSMALEFDTQRSDVNATIKEPATTTNGRSGMPITMEENSLLGSGNGTYSLNGYDTFDTRGSESPAVFPSDTRLGASGTYGHIALTYPGIIDSYKKYPITETDNKSRWKGYENARSMYHISSIDANLINDEDLDGNQLLWHHVTFKWIPHTYDDKATIKYSYNDKNVDGKENFNKTSFHFKRIDKEVIVDPKLFNADTSGKILWGFTGANGHTEDVASKMVVFESIPAMASGQVSATVTNLDNGKIVTEQDNYVPHGANLEFNYQVEFMEGRENWKDIKGLINPPKHVNFTTYTNPGDYRKIIATVEYEDGTKEYVYSGLDGYLEKIGTPLNQPLGNINGNVNRFANVKIYGTATNDTDKEYTVDPESAVYTGSNAIASTNTPEFIIGTPKTWTLNLVGGEEIDLPYKSEGTIVKLPTELSYSDDHEISEDDEFTYTINISGVDQTYTIIDKTSGKLDLDLTDILGEEFWDIFQQDTTRTVTITASDRDNIKSNSIYYQINVVPNRLLTLEVTPDLEFQNITNFSLDPVLNRVTDYDVIVNSLKNPWTLSVSSTKLTSESGNGFNGNLIYVNEDKVDYLDGQLVPVASDINSYDPQAVPINIADRWENDTGLLLQQAGNNEAGKYTGTVSWQVGDYMGEI